MAIGSGQDYLVFDGAVGGRSHHGREPAARAPAVIFVLRDSPLGCLGHYARGPGSHEQWPIHQEPHGGRRHCRACSGHAGQHLLSRGDVQRRLLLWGFNDNGTNNGLGTTTAIGRRIDYGYSAHFQADGKVVVIGECDNAGGDREFCFLRKHPTFRG